MTEAELAKERKRKESNRISAKRCRRKQKEEYERNKMVIVTETKTVLLYKNIRDIKKVVKIQNIHVLFLLLFLIFY